MSFWSMIVWTSNLENISEFRWNEAGKYSSVGCHTYSASQWETLDRLLHLNGFIDSQTQTWDTVEKSISIADIVILDYLRPSIAYVPPLTLIEVSYRRASLKARHSQAFRHGSYFLIGSLITAAVLIDRQSQYVLDCLPQAHKWECMHLRLFRFQTWSCCSTAKPSNLLLYLLVHPCCRHQHQHMREIQGRRAGRSMHRERQ